MILLLMMIHCWLWYLFYYCCYWWHWSGSMTAHFPFGILLFCYLPVHLPRCNFLQYLILPLEGTFCSVGVSCSWYIDAVSIRRITFLLPVLEVVLSCHLCWYIVCVRDICYFVFLLFADILMQTWYYCSFVVTFHFVSMRCDCGGWHCSCVTMQLPFWYLLMMPSLSWFCVLPFCWWCCRASVEVHCSGSTILLSFYLSCWWACYIVRDGVFWWYILDGELGDTCSVLVLGSLSCSDDTCCILLLYSEDWHFSSWYSIDISVLMTWLVFDDDVLDETLLMPDDLFFTAMVPFLPWLLYSVLHSIDDSDNLFMCDIHCISLTTILLQIILPSH